ncbi:MAG: transcriptional regulator [Rhizobiales bacterium 32-66-11]|nr:MAG: transcriptional regulator [Rhizobiales bacterium 32-66-11]
MNMLYFSAFRAVMLTGTVSAAAELLGRSQPAVSRLLDRLEGELGVSLFERRRGLVTPTAAARLLLDEVERAYASLETLKSFAQKVADGENSRIAIGVMPALGITFLPKLLSRFREDWPHTRVQLNVWLSAKIEEWAVARQIEFGLAETPLRRSGFRTEIFSDTPYFAAVRADHPLARKSRLVPADLVGTPFISWTSFVSAGPLIAQAFRSNGIKLDPAYETTLSSSAYEMAKQGLGVALVDPYTAIQQHDERVVLLPFAPTIPFNVALLRPDSRPMSRAAEALIERMMTERDAIMAQLPR